MKMRLKTKEIERGEIRLDLISVSEASKLIGISRGVLYFLIKRYDIERFIIGNKIYITKSTLEFLRRSMN